MFNIDNKEKWEEYYKNELAIISPALNNFGFRLEKEQPHLGGEKYLMQAVTTASGKKLILLARRVSDNKRVIIKVTRDIKGIYELEHERVCRAALKNIIFAYKDFFYPAEILFVKDKGYAISAQEYIEQKISFFDRPLEEQFYFVLKAFKTQEGAHATTYRHKKIIAKTFGEKNTEDYVHMFSEFKSGILKCLSDNKRINLLIDKAESLITANSEMIEQYCGFLTHTDFVPHNFRIVGDDIYLLDVSSIRFGNKYEGWARFLNFMTLHNRPLENALIFYIRNNRAEEEYRSLELMRVYRLGEIILFYANSLEKTSGDLKILTESRVEFWSDVLEAALQGKQVAEDIVNRYCEFRDKLRSKEEKERQKELY